MRRLRYILIPVSLIALLGADPPATPPSPSKAPVVEPTKPPSPPHLDFMVIEVQYMKDHPMSDWTYQDHARLCQIHAENGHEDFARMHARAAIKDVPDDKMDNVISLCQVALKRFKKDK